MNLQLRNAIEAAWDQARASVDKVGNARLDLAGRKLKVHVKAQFDTGKFGDTVTITVTDRGAV